MASPSTDRRSRADGLAPWSATFAAAAVRYWLLVFPRVCLELRRWRRRAENIADPATRAAALDALAKRSNMEGAAAFAALGPRRRRRDLVTALVALQTIYNHVDMLAERHPGGASVERARRLHQALLTALDSGPAAHDHGTAGLDRVEQSPADADGYLVALIERCQVALRRLPRYSSIAPLARTAAERIVEFQSLSLGPREGLEKWARHQALPRDDFRWWETAAAAGSSLGLYALVAAAAAPRLRDGEPAELDAAYFPAIGALHSLLDSAVDLDEDAATGQLRLLDCYATRDEAAARMRILTRTALIGAQGLPHGRRHALLVVAMACNYLSARDARTGGARAVARAVQSELGPRARLALLVFRLRSAGRRSDVGDRRAVDDRADDARAPASAGAPASTHVTPRDPSPDARAA